MGLAGHGEASARWAFEHVGITFFEAIAVP